MHLKFQLLNMFDNTPLKPEKIHVREFKILKRQINSPLSFKTKYITYYKSDVGFEMAFDLEKGFVKADIQANAATISTSKNKEEADSFFHIAFFFEIEDIDEHVII